MAHPPRSGGLAHMPALDGVRGVGVSGVLLFHAGHLRGGWLGVDLFFVLSGFLITSLLLDEFEQRGRISISVFWARRARRLLPALFATLVGVAAYAALLAAPEDLARIRGDGLATLLYVANWHMLLAGHDYWRLFEQPSPLDHTWSLAIEEQIYLLWPPLAYLVLRRSRGSAATLAWLSGLLAGLSAIWMAYLFDPRSGTARVYFGTDTRAAATLLGAVLAGALRGPVKRWPADSLRVADLAALAATTLLAVAWLRLDGTDPFVYRGGLFGVAIASSVLLAGPVLAPRGLIARGLSLPPLRWLGTVSYGVYLWHWPIYLALTPERMGLGGAALTGLRVATTLVAAALSYYLLERPIRRGALPRRASLPLAAVSTALVAAALFAATSPGADVEPAPTTADRLDVLLIGDSMAQALGPELGSVAAERGLRVNTLARFACTVLRSERLRFSELAAPTLELGHCEQVRELWRSSVERRDPRFVVLVEGWPGHGDREVQGRWRHPCQPEYDRAYATDLTAMLRDLGARGSRIAIALLPPPFASDLPRSFTDLWPGASIGELEVEFSARVACQNRVRREVAATTGALILDLSTWVCPDGECRREMDGDLLRSDGLHFRGAGARSVARWLLDQLEAPSH